MTRQIWKPHDYQRAMLDHILDAGPRTALWVPMGQGKSVVVLTALDILFLTGEETKPALIVAPLRVAQSTWPDEAAKWDHLRALVVQPILGSLKERLAALRNTKANVFTINYENVGWLVKYFERKPWPFGRLVPDEATRLKGLRISMRKHQKTGKEYLAGQGTLRAKALATIAHKEDGATGVIELTGTPSPNGLQDLWGQVWFLDRGVRLGRTYTGFAQRWFTASYDGYGLVPATFAQEQIQERCKDLCLSVEPLTIDKPIVANIYVDLPPKARALYTEMEKRMFMEIKGHEIEAFGAAARTLKCLQLANGAVYVGDDNKQFEEVHDAKIQALDSVIAEAAGASVLVAYHFKSDLSRLLRAFPAGRPLDADPKTIRDWNAGKIPLLFAHPASAGHGLNLQDGGNIIVFFGHWWNLEEYLQIIERIGPTRQLQSGHPRPVYQYNIVARDTVDEAIIDRRDSKRAVQDILMDYMKRKKV
jgi:SNF2 family DNA or RNA helicase